jgi:HD-GYP domain-containing protein (c-di-GMP phosphodiesterase class II)
MTLEARILAVCDVYDALVSNRAYRAAFAKDEALNILRAEAGTKLDRRCVAALTEIVAVEAEPAPEALAV